MAKKGEKGQRDRIGRILYVFYILSLIGAIVLVGQIIRIQIFFKPDPAIYRLLLSRYGLIPQESVFIDDLPVNVEAARALGIRGIVFQSTEQVERELSDLSEQRERQTLV